jgi:filamentous hemagglutinin family protein
MRGCPPLSFAGWISIFLAFSSLESKPEGLTLVSGEAHLSESTNSGECVVACKTEKTILEWDRFSIGASEKVRFDQLGPNAAVLNRVRGLERSELLGSLSSNGQVFLINPNGIIIGAHARIDAAGFVAASLDVLNESFLREHNLLFSGNGRGAVVNLGVVTAPRGNIALLGNVVENKGSLEAPAGSVLLGVGEEVLLQPEENPHLLIRTKVGSEEEPKEGAALTHEGRIEALRAELKAGSSVYGRAIQSGGIINALSIEEQGGEVYLVAEEGICILEGANIRAGKGGIVHVLGDQVGIFGKTEIDASGKKSGGSILIGGDFQGSNPEIKNAKRTFIGPDVRLSANAEKGDGGRVIVWSDHETNYLGHISLQKGSENGVGGFAEISGGILDYRGTVEGAREVLFDPTDITISGTAAPTGGSFGAGVWTSTAATATIPSTTDANSIQTLLAAGTNVTINTSTASGGPFAGDGVITYPIGNTITWSTNAVLTLIADARVVMQGSLINTSASTGTNVIKIQANGGGAFGGSGIGFSISAPGTISTNGQNILIQASGNKAGGPGSWVEGAITSTSGSITIIGLGGGNLTTSINPGISCFNTISTGGSGIITLNGTGGNGTANDYGISISGGTIRTTGAASIVMTGQGGLSTTGSNEIGVYVSSGGSITTSGTGSITIQAKGGVGSGGSNIGFYLHAQTNPTVISTSGGGQLLIDAWGGSGGANNYGMAFDRASSTLTVSGSAILNGTGGNGAGSNYGIYINGVTVGTEATTNQLILNGSSLGTTSSEHGIFISSGGALVGNAGTLSLNGVGGGLYTSSGSNNHGVFLSGATLTAGVAGTAGLNTINVTGIGGTGRGGAHYGAYTSTSLTTNLLGGNPNNSLNFINCLGGSGSAGNNNGVYLSAATSMQGNLTFRNCTGGSGGGGNHGVLVSAAVSASNILGTDVFGGNGAGGDFGYLINGTGTLGSSVTEKISLSGGTLGTGTAEDGIALFTGGTIQVGDGGTIELFGTGGGLYTNSTAQENMGVLLAGNLIAGVAGSNGLNTINITGIGGAGQSFGHRGVYIPSAASFTLNGTNPNNSVNFINCSGGTAGMGAANYGVDFETSVSIAGILTFRNCTGGTSSSGNNMGVLIGGGSTVAAQNIIGTDVYGGYGQTGNNFGYYIIGTLGASTGVATTRLLSLTGGSLGVRNGEKGIYLENGSSLIVGNGGTINLIGTGGGLYTSAAGGSCDGVLLGNATISAGVAGQSGLNTINITGIGGTGQAGSHRGVYVGGVTVNLLGTNPNNSLNFVNCLGGSGAGAGNYGILFQNANLSMQGNLTFQNCVGGNGGLGNSGVLVDSNATIAASNITALDVMGGTGLGNNYGFYVGGTVGNLSTSRISLTAGSLGVNGNEYGIYVNGGTLQVGNAGTINLTGTGGGIYTGTGGNCYGVNLNGAIFNAGGAGTGANTINITGMGGYGAGGTNYGVNTSGSLTVNFSGGNPNNSLNFLNCIGGSGVGGNNFGISFGSNLSFQGSLNLQNITGGNGGSANFGFFQSGNCTIAPSNIIATDVMGGLGVGTNIGLAISAGSTLGSSLTNTISISAGSLGTRSNEWAIYLSPAVAMPATAAAAIQVGNGGTITLNGLGGGIYNATGSANYGIYINGGTLTAGVLGQTGLNTIKIQGMGGSGSGGSHHGVILDSGATINLLGTNPNNSLNFLNCIGGSGVGGVNTGVFLAASQSYQGNLTFQNCTGGTGGSFNRGVFVTGGITVSASNINMVDVLGGGSVNNNYGCEVDGTLGNVSTSRISITAGSLGTGSNEYGIYVASGTVQVGNAGTINLTGTGGGVYTSTGGSCHGVYLNGATLNAGGAGTGANTINITGMGGYGAGGSNYGVNTAGVVTVNFSGGNPNNSLNFLNCIGGSGVTGSNYGVNIATSFAHQGNLTFQNCTGGTGGGNNYGVLVNGTLNPSNLIATDIMGGPGNSADVGFYFSAGTLGSSMTGRIAIIAGSLGLGNDSNGIAAANGTAMIVGDGGTISLIGTGGGSYTNSSATANVGLNISGVSFNAGVAGLNGLNTINLTGIGGAGASDGALVLGAHGFNLQGTNPNNSVNFINCIGGQTGLSRGVAINTSAPVQLLQGTLSFINCTGGSGSIGTGILMTGSSTAWSAPSILIRDVVGGPGTGSAIYSGNRWAGNVGVYINGGATLGSAITKQLIIQAQSLGKLSGEAAIVIDNANGTTANSSLVVGDGGTITLVGTGGGLYSSNGNSNYGIYLNSGTITAGTVGGSGLNTINLTGMGGNGTGGSSLSTGHIGIYCAGSSSIVLNGTNPNNSINFINSSGGSGVGGFNVGVELSSGLATAGTINFQNCTGGVGGGNNHGLYISSTVGASNILANDVLGGPGSGSNIGIYITSGSLGNINTGRISLVGGSLGTGSSEYGIYVNSGTVRVGNGGTLTLNGVGGGLYTTAAASNYGVYLNGASLIAGIAGQAGLNTVTVSGTGGTGTGGTHYGVNVGTSLTLTLDGTNVNNSVNFTNTTGGVGGNGNIGLNVGASTTLSAGILNISNVTGGGGSTSTGNHGVSVASTLDAPTLKAMDVMGGPGAGSNIGFYVPSGTVGSNTVADLISIQAGSLGTGAGEVGIQVDGTGIIQTALAGTVTLQGIGGNGTGSANYGVYLKDTGSVVGKTGAIAATGIAGIGSTAGIYLDAGTSISSTTGSITLNTLLNQSVSLVGNNVTSSLSTTTGNMTFAAPVQLLTNTVRITSATSGNIFFNGTVDGSGISLIANAAAGGVTFAQEVGASSALGTIQVTAGAGITIDANMTTVGGVNGAMTFASPVLIGGGALLDTTNSGGVAGGGNITFSSTIDSLTASVQSLTLNAGTSGIISVSGAVGATHPLNALTLVNTGGATFSGNVSAASVFQQAGTATTFAAAISTSGPGGINLTSNSITFAGAITLTGAGSFEANGPVILSTNPTSINTSAGNGYILFTNTVNSAPATNIALSLTAGAGPITFSGIVGGSAPLSSLTINSASNVLFSGNATIASGGAVSITHSGLLTIPSGALITAPGGFTESAGTVGGNTDGAVALGGNITTTNTAILFNTPILLTAANPTLTSGGGAITFNAGSTIRPVASNTQGLTLIADDAGHTLFGTVTFNENVGTGALPIGALSIQYPNNISLVSTANIYASSLSVTNGQGTASFNGKVQTTAVGGVSITSSAITLADQVTTASAGPASFTGPVTLGGSVAIDTSSGGGAVSFSSTIDGTHAFSVNAGAGLITFGGSIGPVTTVDAVSLTTTNIAGLTLPQSIRCNSAAFNAPVHLSGGATVVTTITDGMSFSSTIDGTQALTLNTGTNIAFGGDIGATTPLTSLTAIGPVSLTANTSINTITDGISFTDTINGDFSLTLNSAATVTLGGAVGGTTPVAGIVVNGTGLTLNDSIYTNNETINLSGIPVTLGSNVLLNTQNGQTGFTPGLGADIYLGSVTGANDLSIDTGSGTSHLTQSMTAIGDLSVSGAAASLEGITITSSSAIFNAPVLLSVGANAITADLNGNLVFNSTIDNGQALTLTTSGTGAITLNGTIGANTPVGALTITSGTTTVFQENITAASLNVTGASQLANSIFVDTSASNGNITFQAVTGSIANAESLNLKAGSGTVSLGALGTALIPLSDVTVFSSGTVSVGAINAMEVNITHTGALTLGGSIAATNGFTETGGGAVNLNASITTQNAPITFNDAVTLGAVPNLTTNDGNLTFASTLDGGFAASFSTGIGSITFGGIVGGVTPLTSLTISSAADVSFSADANTTAAVNIAHTGLLTIASGSTIGASGGFVETGSGTVSLGGNITTDNTAIAFNTPILLTATTPTLTSGGGAITFNTGSTIRPVASNTQGLTLIADDAGHTLFGTVTFNENVGTGALPIGALSIQYPNNISLVSTASIYASSLSVTSGQGTASFNGAIATSAIGGVSIASSAITLANNITTASAGPASFTGPVTLGSSVAIDTSSGGGAVSFSSTIDGANAFTVNAGAGAIALGGNVGATTPLGAMSLTTTSLAGLTIPQTVRSTSAIFNAPVHLSGGSTTVTTTTGDMSFASTIDGTQILTLNSAGDITFGGNIGATTPLTSLAVNGPVLLTGNTSVDTMTGGIAFSSTIDGNFSFTLNSATTLSFGGTVGGTTPIAGITVNGTGLTLSDSIYTNNQTIDFSGIPITLGGNVFLNTQNGQTGVSPGTGADILLRTVTGASDLSLNTGSGTSFLTQSITGIGVLTVSGAAANLEGITITPASAVFNAPVLLTVGACVITADLNGDLVFNSTIDNGQALTLTTSGTGTIALNGQIGANTPVGALTITSAASTTLYENITAASVNVTGASQLGNSIFVDTSASNGNITFQAITGSVANGEVLGIAAGSGAVSLGALGTALIPLNQVTIFSSGTATLSAIDATGVSVNHTGALTLGGAIAATNGFTETGGGAVNLNASITTQNAPITFNDAVVLGGAPALTTNDGNLTFASTLNGGFAASFSTGIGSITFGGIVGGVTPLTSLTISSAADVSFSGNATTTAAVSIAHSGLLTVASGSTITAPGGFVETGSGTVSLGGNITTTNNSILFNTPILLTAANPTLTSGGGAITFNAGSTIRPVASNTQGLTLIADDAGHTLFGTVTFNENVGTAALPIDALSIQYPNNISLVSTANIYASSLSVTNGQGTASLNGEIQTTAVGGVSIASSAITLAGNITTASAGPATFTGPVTLGGSVAIDTSSGDGAVSFSSTIDGTNAFTINAGAGAITLGGNVGATTALGTMSLTTTSLAGLTIPQTVRSTSAAFNAPVHLSGGSTTVTTTTGDMSYASTIDGTQALTLNSAGNITFGGNLGATTPLSSLAVNGPVILTGNTSVDTMTGGIAFSGAIDGNYNLTLNSATTVSFGGIVGGVAPIAGLTLSGTGITLSSNIYTNNQTIDFSSIPVTLSGNVFLNTQNSQTGGSFGSGAPIVLGTVTGAHTLTLHSGNNTIDFNGIINAITALTITEASTVTVSNAISTTGAVNMNTSELLVNANITSGGAMSLTHTGGFTIKGALNGASFSEQGGGLVTFSDVSGSVVVTGTAQFNSPILLAMDPTITGADIVINNTVDGAQDLHINASSSATFTGAATVGFTTPITALDVQAPAIAIGANQRVAGDITYTGAVTLTHPVSFNAEGSGSLTVTGVVTTQGFDLSGFAAGDVTFQSLIDARSTSGGNVTLISSGANVTVNSINTSATGLTGTAGSIYLQPASSYTTVGANNYPDGLIVLQGSATVTLTATSPTGFGKNGSILLSPRGRAAPQSVATIVSSTSGNDLTIDTGSLLMGTNEAMTILGSITLGATNYTALSDIVALDDITLPGVTVGCATPGETVNYWPSNFLISRPPAPLLDDTGSTYFSSNTHILAGGSSLTYCSGSVTPNCSTATPPVTRNIGLVPGGLSSSQLMYSGRILNFDTESVPPPNPPAPTPTPSGVHPQSFYIHRLLYAETELQELLPLFWRSTHLRRIPKICPIWDRTECQEHFTRLPSFIFENDVL